MFHLEKSISETLKKKKKKKTKEGRWFYTHLLYKPQRWHRYRQMLRHTSEACAEHMSPRKPFSCLDTYSKTYHIIQTWEIGKGSFLNKPTFWEPSSPYTHKQIISFWPVFWRLQSGILMLAEPPWLTLSSQWEKTQHMQDLFLCLTASHWLKLVHHGNEQRQIMSRSLYHQQHHD